MGEAPLRYRDGLDRSSVLWDGLVTCTELAVSRPHSTSEDMPRQTTRAAISRRMARMPALAMSLVRNQDAVDRAFAAHCNVRLRSQYLSDFVLLSEKSMGFLADGSPSTRLPPAAASSELVQLLQLSDALLLEGLLVPLVLCAAIRQVPFQWTEQDLQSVRTPSQQRVQLVQQDLKLHVLADCHPSSNMEDALQLRGTQSFCFRVENIEDRCRGYFTAPTSLYSGRGVPIMSICIKYIFIPLIVPSNRPGAYAEKRVDTERYEIRTPPLPIVSVLISLFSSDADFETDPAFS
jgi:hypothetical protein